MIGEYYDREGRPISREDWGRLCMEGLDPDGHYGAQSYKRIGEKHFEGGVWVSTVWLGLDHNFGDGPPVIFESMLFWPDSEWDQDCRRYSTEQEAIDGHHRIVENIRAGQPPFSDEGIDGTTA